MLNNEDKSSLNDFFFLASQVIVSDSTLYFKSTKWFSACFFNPYISHHQKSKLANKFEELQCLSYTVSII